MLIQDLSSVQSISACLKFGLQQNQTVFSDFFCTSTVCMFLILNKKEIILCGECRNVFFLFSNEQPAHAAGTEKVTEHCLVLLQAKFQGEH